MNSQLYEKGNPAALLPKLQHHWPATQFNLDIVKCQEILEKVIRTEFIEYAFVAGGFFICFNKLAPFSQKFKLYFDSCVNKYGLSIFLISVKPMILTWKKLYEQKYWIDLYCLLIWKNSTLPFGQHL